jgi:hypothetical protein
MTEEWDQREEEEDFVELGGMAGDAVAEVDGPGEMGRRAVGVVGEASEKASDASNGDPEGERDGVEVAGRGAESDVALDEFDGEEAEGEGSDDGFASDEIGGVVDVFESQARVFEIEDELGAQSCACDRGSQDGPAERSGDGISEAAAESEVDGEGNDIGQSFEEEMRMDGIGTEVEIDGEGGGEMGGEDDREL